MSRLWFVLALLGAGCTERALGVGADGGAGECGTRSLPTCENDGRCMLQPGCCGSQKISCVAAGTPQQVCPCIVDCPSRDETSCADDLDCRADYCYACACTPSFVGCSHKSNPAPACPDFGCPTPLCDCHDLLESDCLAEESSQGCYPVYCSDCMGGQIFSQCFGPTEDGACPNNCVETACRGQSDCPNGGLCLAPPSSMACGGDFCPAGPACKSNSDCGKSQICGHDPCCPNAAKACLPGCLNGCPTGQKCGADGLCAQLPCKSDSDCNPPCSGPLNCEVDFCVDNLCYPSLGTCGPPPV